MKNCKKLISSILTLTLFAGAVNNFTCFATTTNSDKPNIEQAQQEKIIDFNRCSDYAKKLDFTKIYHDFNYALEELNDLKEKISAKPEDEALLANQIKSTELYLYKRELDDIKEYINENLNKFYWCRDDDFLNKAFNRLENLNNKINENCKRLLAEDIKSIELYLYKNELDDIKKYINKKLNNFCVNVDFFRHDDFFNKAFNRLENLNNKINENYKTLLAEDIKSTELYLIKMQSEALKKLSNCCDNDLRDKANRRYELANEGIIQALKGMLDGMCISAACFMVAFAFNTIQLNTSFF